MKQLLIIALVCNFVLPSKLFSQKMIDQQNNAWISAFSTVKLTDKLNLKTSYQFRRNDCLKTWQQSLTRISIDYDLDDNLSVANGYDWLITFPYGAQPISTTVNEFRIFEQFTLVNNIYQFNFSHRYRIEQRITEKTVLNENNEKEVQGYKFRQRVRYRFQLSVPLLKNTTKQEMVYATVSDEVFLGFGKNIAKNVLDQNRIYFGLGWKFNKHYKLEAGYLNHYMIKNDGVHAELNHTAQLSAFYNFDLSSKRK
ncbi:MAG: DUF2490 domain-containing protein [Putridiphycobacter sp.]|nr:DUF2490 domain-containing protein [Putridiphycobacter sp.]